MTTRRRGVRVSVLPVPGGAAEHGDLVLFDRDACEQGGKGGIDAHLCQVYGCRGTASACTAHLDSKKPVCYPRIFPGRSAVSFTAPIQLPGLTLDPQWYRRSVFYEVMVRSFVDSNGDGSGDLQGLISRARLPAVARRRRAVASAVLHVAAARRRLRRRRLPRDPARVRHARRVQRAGDEGARAQHARHHRPAR